MALMVRGSLGVVVWEVVSVDEDAVVVLHFD